MDFPDLGTTVEKKKDKLPPPSRKKGNAGGDTRNRSALQSIGLGHTLAPMNVITIKGPCSEILLNETWRDLEFEVALDSGAVVHVCAPADCPGYNVLESPGSRQRWKGREVERLYDTPCFCSDTAPEGGWKAAWRMF